MLISSLLTGMLSRAWLFARRELTGLATILSRSNADRDDDNDESVSMFEIVLSERDTDRAIRYRLAKDISP